MKLREVLYVEREWRDPSPAGAAIRCGTGTGRRQALGQQVSGAGSGGVLLAGSAGEPVLDLLHPCGIALDAPDAGVLRDPPPAGAVFRPAPRE